MCPRELLDFLFLARHIAAVQQDAADLGIAAVGEVLDGRRDVVGRVERHLLAGCHNQHVLRIALANRRGKAAADDIAEHVVEHDVRLLPLEELEVLEQVERRDDAAPCAAESRRRPARLDAEHAAKAARRDCLERSGLFIELPHVAHDGLQRLAAEQVDRRIRLWVTANLDDLLPLHRQCRCQIARQRRLPNAALPVHRNFLHDTPPLR